MTQPNRDKVQMTLSSWDGEHELELGIEDVNRIAKQLMSHSTVVMIQDVPCEHRYAVDIYNALVEWFYPKGDKK